MFALKRLYDARVLIPPYDSEREKKIWAKIYAGNSKSFFYYC